LPTVTFKGPYMWKRRTDMAGHWERGLATEVSQAWLDEWRHTVKNPDQFIVQGDEGGFVDEGNDGIPDKSWTIKSIRGWLEDNGANPKGYATKSKLLAQVQTILNPPVVDEEIIDEGPVDKTTGDEE